MAKTEATMTIERAKEIVQVGFAWANWTCEQKEAFRTLLLETEKAKQLQRENAHLTNMLLEFTEERAESTAEKCKNCKYFFCESAVDRYFHCNNIHGLKNVDVVENETFCSYFEPKENENG